MSSNDVRDVLNLPDSAAGSRPTKKQKLSAPRPNLKGLAREVHNLGGDNPIAIVPEVTSFKKRRLASRKPAARWELKGFHNSAREDQSLVLRHWRRKEEKPSHQQDQAGQEQSQDANDESKADVKQEDQKQGADGSSGEVTEDSAFAKYNAQISVPQYSDEQYRQSLTSDEWSKEETDYLMGLVKDFDLRWPLIWDRYEWSPPATNGEANADGDESKAIVPVTQARTMEDLKARYYEVAAKMMAIQKPVQYMTQPEFALHETMAHFNPQQEKARKEFALNALSRSREDAREEESLLLEIKRILARSERFNEDRRELYSRLDYPHAETDISSFKSSAGLQSLLQNLMTADKSKKRKSLMGPDGASPSNPAAAQAQAQAQEASRRESTAASTGGRDSTAAPTPTGGNKKGQQQQPPAERPKLTEKEEQIYGVTHHDRLGSGPTFRMEKINKAFSHKSNQQAIRINNVLNELDIPQRLAMPTAATTSQYEQLLGAVNSLLDARKVSDKLDAEIKLERAKKAEREKALAPAEPEDADKKGTAGEDDSGQAEGESTGDAAAATKDKAPATDEAPQAGGDGDDAEAGETGLTNGEESTTKADEAKAEDDGEKSGRPGSSGAPQKRSASVLSAVSDKSAKRQKK